MGGSWCSSGNVASKYARYHFRPHFQQHAGFRLVAPADASQAVDGAFITSCTDAPAPYVGEAYPFRSSDPLKAKGYADAAMHSVNVALAAHYPNLNTVRHILVQFVTIAILQYCAGTAEYSASYYCICFVSFTAVLHYVQDTAMATNAAAQSSQFMLDAFKFPQHCASIAAQYSSNSTNNSGGVTKALDIGCGPGSVSFELARHFDSVLGIEIDADQLAAARTLQQHGELHYNNNSSNTTTTDTATSTSSASIDPEVDRSRVSFRQCDPMSLPVVQYANTAVAAICHNIETNVAVTQNTVTHDRYRTVSPASLLNRMGGAAAVIKHSGILIVTSPWDWQDSWTYYLSQPHGHADTAQFVMLELIVFNETFSVHRALYINLSYCCTSP
eukprot:9948-Heterococcus_DN1.PRE.1